MGISGDSAEKWTFTDRYVNDTKLDLITAKEERDTANIERDRHKQRADNASRALKISIANAVESELQTLCFQQGNVSLVDFACVFGGLWFVPFSWAVLR